MILYYIAVLVPVITLLRVEVLHSNITAIIGEGDSELSYRP